MIKFFIYRPIFASVIALLILLGGLATVFSLPITQYPNITPPTVQVSAVYPGADATTVAQTIGVPIEEQVNGVEGMVYMNSTSSSNGSYNLTITFKVGTDIDMATVLVQNRVNAAQGSLPSVVIQQGISIRKQSSNIVMFLTLNSTDSIYNSLYLSNYANLNIVDRMSRLPGVGNVNVFGAGDYSMRIWMDPDKMRIRGLDPSAVYQAIASQNQQVSAGSVGQNSRPSYGAEFEYSLSVSGRLSTVKEFENIIITNQGDGKLLRLKDIAKVEVGSQTYGTLALQNGEQCSAIAVYQSPGSNALDVADEIKKELETVKSYLPDGVTANIMLDTTLFVKASINEIVKTFVETLLLVVLVILLFLQSIRAMIIPVIVIPISIIGTFTIMNLFGFSINTLTLFGLVLAIAIVVDDAIVVVENATRYMSGADTPDKRRQVVASSMNEIIGPIVGIVLVLLSVFVPTAFIGGITGQLYRQFALTIAIATLISGIVSLLFTPAMCAIFLRGEKSSNDKNGPNEGERRFFIFVWFNKAYNALEHWYVGVVKVLLNHTKAVILLFLLLLAITAFLYMKTPSSFIPDEDEGYFIVAVQLPPSASLDRTIAVTDKIYGILSSYPEVANVMVINGVSFMGGGNSSNSGSLFVILKPWSERKQSNQSSFSVINRLNAETADILDAVIFAVSPPAIPGLGSSSGLEVEIEDINNFGDLQLADAVSALTTSYREYPSLLTLNSQYQANTPSYLLNINRDKLELTGINIADLFSTLSYYLGSAYVNNYVEYGRIFQVKIQADERTRELINDVLKLSVENPNGDMVPLSSLITPREIVGSSVVNRYNMYTSAAVTAIVNPAYSSSQAISDMENLIKDKLQSNYGYQWTSVAYQQIEAGSSIFLILFLSIFVVYLVLAAQYESLGDPIAVLMGVPFALLGALIGTIIHGLSVSIYTQIGIVLLIALSAKNSILIVQFAIDYAAQGKTSVEAAIEAGRVRLRPILMTSFAFILGVLPLMFATGAGAESRIYLGTAVVWGMTFNTLFGTLFVPNFYHFLQENVV